METRSWFDLQVAGDVANFGEAPSEGVVSGVTASSTPMAVATAVVSGRRTGSDIGVPFLLVGVGNDGHRTRGGVDESSMRRRWTPEIDDLSHWRSYGTCLILRGVLR